MSNAPVTDVDVKSFTANPYPALARMRADAPITYVPQFGATLITRRDDIHQQEKRTHVFSSVQPDGLMTRLMGENMMRKEGAQHERERKILFPALSPRTVREHWKPIFQQMTSDILDKLVPRGECNLVTDFALPVAAEALIAITGLSNLSARQMDQFSRAMIDGCANFAGHSEIEIRCRAATALIDAHIDGRLADLRHSPDQSVLSVQHEAGLALCSTRANIKLIISGGQNEPRDAIAGTIWALLTHPDQLRLVRDGFISFGKAYAEYTRWISPIGMSPRRVIRRDTVGDVTFEPEDRMFLMFGSACRDEAHFNNPDHFDITRNTQAAISFGAGPHYCAGAAAARCLITEVALPMAFERLQNLKLAGKVPITGWAFRGPTAMPVTWTP